MRELADSLRADAFSITPRQESYQGNKFDVEGWIVTYGDKNMLYQMRPNWAKGPCGIHWVYDPTRGWHETYFRQREGNFKSDKNKKKARQLRQQLLSKNQ